MTFAGTARVEVSLSSGQLDGYLSRIDNATGDPVVVPVATTYTAVSDVSLISFTQRPDPMTSARGGSLFVTLQNNGPDNTEGALELTISVAVEQGTSALVVSNLTGDTASDWDLVSGTYGVSKVVRVRRKSYLSAGATTTIQANVGVAGGGSLGGSFPGNRASVAVKSDPNGANNARTLTVDMTP